jgi:hypothetical protein
MRRPRAGRRPLDAKSQVGLADAHDVAVAKRAFCDVDAIDQKVGALAYVARKDAGGPYFDDGMATATARVAQRNVVAWPAANRGARRQKLKDRASVGPGGHR